MGTGGPSLNQDEGGKAGKRTGHNAQSHPKVALCNSGMANSVTDCHTLRRQPEQPLPLRPWPGYRLRAGYGPAPR